MSRIKPKRSYTANSVPLTTDLETHELAINWVDGKAFTKDSSGNIVSVTLGGSGGGGSGSLSGSVTIPESGDTQWANTVLLLKGDGNLTDSSATPKTVTAVNGATATGAAKYGSASISLDGTQYLSLPYSSAFDLSSGDWTAEAWAYLPTISRRVLFGINSGADYVAAVLVMVNDDGSVYLLCESSSGSWIGTPSNNQTSAGAFPAAQWNHVAAVRAGDVFTLYINGVSAVTYTNSAAQSNRSAASYIGFRQADSGGIWNGRVDDVRITKAARYSGSSFTPPAAHPTGTYTAAQTLPVTITGSGGGGSGLTWSSVPASATATGTAGSIAYDGSYFYIATQNNTWKRAAVSTWANFAPTALSGLSVWFDSSDASTLYDATSGGSLAGGNTTVKRWQDKSGNNRHATSNTGPTRKTAAINSLDALLFDGSTSNLSFSGNVYGTSGYTTVFAVVRKASVSGTAMIMSQDNGNLSPRTYQYLRVVDASLQSIWFTSGPTAQNVSAASPVSANTTFLATLRIGAGGGAVSLNGTAGTANSNVSGVLTNTEPTYIGAFAYAGNEFGGHICEVVAYDSALSDANKAVVESYLMTKWGIA